MNKKLIVGAAIAAATLAACGPKSTPPPPPPPPPPVPVVYIPPRPTPPLGASPLLVVPPLGVDGRRQTVNLGIGTNQAIWNLRSAYNVAALNCQKAGYEDILSGYKNFLKVHKKALLAANKGVDGDFRKRYGASFIKPREAYMTQVYNYYAFPPTLGNFCDAALIMAHESMTLKPAGLNDFAARYVPQLDTVYNNFYRSYEQYKADAAAWDAKYAPQTVQIAPAGPTTATTTTAAPGR
ncbi:MAG: hypothetical protein ACKOOL_04020 [Novosphingobium sp.]